MSKLPSGQLSAGGAPSQKEIRGMTKRPQRIQFNRAAVEGDTQTSPTDAIPKVWGGQAKQLSDLRKRAEIVKMAQRLPGGRKEWLGDQTAFLTGDLNSNAVRAIESWQQTEQDVEFDNLIERVIFDLSDPVQRKMADEVLPNITEKRLQILDAVYDQARFIDRLAHVRVFNNKGDLQRAIKILGGAEPLLLSASPFLRAAGAGVHSFPDDEYFGLYAPTETTLVDYYQRAGDENDEVCKLLVEITRYLLPCFPRALKGKLAPFSDPIEPRSALPDAAKSLQRAFWRYCGIQDTAAFLRQKWEEGGELGARGAFRGNFGARLPWQRDTPADKENKYGPTVMRGFSRYGGRSEGAWGQKPVVGALGPR